MRRGVSEEVPDHGAEEHHGNGHFQGYPEAFFEHGVAVSGMLTLAMEPRGHHAPCPHAPMPHSAMVQSRC